MKLAHRIAFIATATSLAAGCYNPTPVDRTPISSGGGSRTPYESPQPARNFGGFVRGSLGSVAEFDAPAYVDVNERSAAATSVLIEAAAPDRAWWVNLTMNFSGGISDPALVPGATLEFDADAPTRAGLRVDATGYVGQRDLPGRAVGAARRVTLAVHEGAAGHRRMTFSAYFVDAAAGEQRVDGEYQYAVPVRVLEPTASLEGDMGSVNDFRGGATTVQYSGSYLRLDAEDTAARWWAMVGITMGERGLADPRLVPGAHFVVSGSSYGGGGGLDDLGWYFIGCSGPSHGNYTFDTSPTRVEIDVREGTVPGHRELAFSAYFDDQRVDGSVDFQAN